MIAMMTQVAGLSWSDMPAFTAMKVTPSGRYSAMPSILMVAPDDDVY
jgi:hypothetical protein